MGFFDKLRFAAGTIGKAIVENGNSTRDARIGAVGAQLVRDLYAEGLDQEAKKLAEQYAKASTAGAVGGIAGGVYMASPIVSTITDAALTADGIRHAVSGDGVLKTYRLGKEAIENIGEEGNGKLWFNTAKSATGDALDVFGGVNLLNKGIKIGKEWYRIGDEVLRAPIPADQLANMAAFVDKADNLKSASGFSKMYVGAVSKNNKSLSDFGTKVDRILPDALRKPVAKIYPTPSIRLNSKDLSAYNEGIKFLETDVAQRASKFYDPVSLEQYVRQPYYMGRAERMARPEVGGYHWNLGGSNGSGKESIITIRPEALIDEMRSTGLHEGRHALQSAHALLTTPSRVRQIEDRLNEINQLIDKAKFDTNVGFSEFEKLLDRRKMYLEQKRYFTPSTNGYIESHENRLNDAYDVLLDRTGSSRKMKEKGATNSELRYAISRANGNVTGEELDRIIDNMPPEDLERYLRRVNGYGSDYAEAASRLHDHNYDYAPVKRALKYVPSAAIAVTATNGMASSKKQGGVISYLDYLK